MISGQELQRVWKCSCRYDGIGTFVPRQSVIEFTHEHDDMKYKYRVLPKCFVSVAVVISPWSGIA